MSEDVTTTSTIVCPSCQSLHDLVGQEGDKIQTTKSKYDKNKIAGITNQLGMTSSRFYTYDVPCPHCQHNWEMKGIPIKSVHFCPKCYCYFGIDDVRVTIFSKEKQFKHDFQATPIYPISLFHDMDKLADLWKNSKSSLLLPS